MIQRFAEALKKRLTDSIRALEEQAGAGSCADHAQYRNLTGRVMALKDAQAFIDEEMEKYQHDE